MPTKGVIFSHGIESDFLSLNRGVLLNSDWLMKKQI
jgi:hypothetical protein